MPQFELATFFIQFFWLIVGFFFYVLKFCEKIEILNTVKSTKLSLNYLITQNCKSTLSLMFFFTPLEHFKFILPSVLLTNEAMYFILALFFLFLILKVSLKLFTKQKNSTFFSLANFIMNLGYNFYMVGKCIFQILLAWSCNVCAIYLYIYITDIIYMVRCMLFSLLFFPFLKDWYKIAPFAFFREFYAGFVITSPYFSSYFWDLCKTRGLSAIAWVTVLIPVILSIFFIIGGTVQCFEFELMPESLFESYQSEAELLRLISQYSSTISSVCEIQIRALNCQFYLVKLHNNIFYQLYLTENFQELIIKDYQNLIETNKRYLLEPISDQNNFSKILALTCFVTGCILVLFTQYYNCCMPILIEYDQLEVYKESLK